VSNRINLTIVAQMKTRN